MNIVYKYISSSLWFNVIKVTNAKRQNQKDPFELFKQYSSLSNSIIIEFNCSGRNREECLKVFKDHYNTIYFRYNQCTVLIFNAIPVYHYFKENVLSVEFMAEDVMLNNQTRGVL